MANGINCDSCGTLLAFANFTEDRMILPRFGEEKKPKEEVLHSERYCANPKCKKDEAIVYEGGDDAEGIFKGI